MGRFIPHCRIENAVNRLYFNKKIDPSLRSKLLQRFLKLGVIAIPVFTATFVSFLHCGCSSLVISPVSACLKLSSVREESWLQVLRFMYSFKDFHSNIECVFLLFIVTMNECARV